MTGDNHLHTTTDSDSPLPSSSPTKPRSLEDHRLKVPAAQRVALDPSDPDKPRSFSERILDVMSNVVPIKKLNPEEYAAALEEQRLAEEKEALERKRADNGQKPS